MEGTWDVWEEAERVGQCAVTREGLYYRIRCRCENRRGLYRLFWGTENLGVLEPEGQDLVLETRQAVKRFAAGRPRFRLEKPQERMFVPLRPGESVPCLQELEQARFVRQEGQPGLSILRII